MPMQEPDRQPDELGALKTLVEEFIDKFNSIEQELDLLKESQKELVEEYSDRLDMKTLKAAMRTVKIKKKVDHKDTFDVFCEILDQKETV